MDMLKYIYSEELKKSVVEEIESGKISIAMAAHEYSIPKSNVHLWLKEYGRYRPERKKVEVVMKSEKDKIEQMQKALADAHLKLRIYEEIIEMAGKKYKTDLKKTFGTLPSASSKGKAVKSKGSAIS